jgi:sugar O-acyltransferase (sialic acid O-acetyltransferase NeuD family)
MGELQNGTRALIVIGAGGLGTEYTWVAESMNAAASSEGRIVPWRMVGYCDDDPSKRGSVIGRFSVHGDVAATAAVFGGQEVAFAVAVGKNATRERLVQQAVAAGWQPATLVHPSVVVAPNAQLGAGSYVAPGCVIFPNAVIGEHVIVNTHASVGHDVVLEDFVQVCPGGRISGGCRLGRRAFVGSNATVTPGVVVGADAVVGANSCAVFRVSAGRTVMGTPAIPVMSQSGRTGATRKESR